MSYFDSKKNVNAYIKMAAQYDGKMLIDILKKYLRKGSSVLELGMGPGKDLDILSQSYEVTGSDSSQVFLDLYRKRNKNRNLLLLDARTISTNQQYDCIYSNKVLIHLTKIELKESLTRQKDILNENGILFHSFWSGDKEEEYHGLKFVYYTEDELNKIIGNNYEILKIATYKEMKEYDSIYVIAQKK
jgi:cyclopropane fatty-acyl-phospholipid synthase-like methyltransferase